MIGIEAIREIAAKHGLDLVGVCSPVVPARDRRWLAQWIQAGMHAEMHWMAESERLARRLDPRRQWPDVRSIIVVGMRYAPPPYTLEQAEKRKISGVISAYAHGDDYHILLKKKLKALSSDLSKIFSRWDARAYVDTAPVLEPALAEQAGLGWIGKHGVVIHRCFGSWFFLGALFTNQALVPSSPHPAHCGRCTRCMDACPTGAIVADRIVDARRCISYLTIEHKGFIPHALRPLIGNRIYGCDDCQLVCPWNRKAKTIPCSEDPLHPDDARVLPKLAELLGLDREGFRARFRKSAIRRIGWERFLRNVCVAAGNSESPALLPLVSRLCSHERALVRAHAAWARLRLAKAEGESAYAFARKAVSQQLAREPDPGACQDLRTTLEVE